MVRETERKRSRRTKEEQKRQIANKVRGRGWIRVRNDEQTQQSIHTNIHAHL